MSWIFSLMKFCVMVSMRTLLTFSQAGVSPPPFRFSSRLVMPRLSVALLGLVPSCAQPPSSGSGSLAPGVEQAATPVQPCRIRSIMSFHQSVEISLGTCLVQQFRRPPSARMQLNCLPSKNRMALGSRLPIIPAATSGSLS